jgi:hypothetical protein
MVKMCVGILIMFTTACGATRHAAQDERLRIAAGYALEYHALSGHYPSKLAELCAPPTRACAVDGGTPWMTDEWGTALDWSAAESTFVVRSAGSDRVLGTADDVVLDERMDHEQASAVQGCFLLPVGVSGAAERTVSLAATRTSGAWYSATLTPPSDSLEVARWHPEGMNRVRIRVGRSGRVRDFLGTVSAESLVLDTESRDRVARRVPCA